MAHTARILAQLYDPLDPDRSDLDVDAAVVDELVGGSVLIADSTLRFRGRDEVQRSLAAAGFDVVDVRDAPDRPGRELVFLARPAG